MIEPKISIIVPVYNVDQYLPKCLDSLFNQTYSNIEIICINDQSSDNSLNILHDYAQKDTRIRIINQQNAGVSAARNRGIEVASGEYLMFLDADDWIDLNTCQVVSKVALEHSSDAVLWSYIREFPTNSQSKTIFNEDIIIFTDFEVKQKLERRFYGLINEELKYPENADAIVTVWGKLYRLQLIKENKLQFVDLNLIGSLEDALFNINFFHHVSKAVYVNEFFNHYRKNNSSSVTSKYRSMLFSQWQNLFGLMEKNIEVNRLDIKYKQALNNRIAFSIIGLGLNELSNKTSSLAKIRKIKKIVSSTRYKVACKELKINYFPLHWKVFFLFAKYRYATGIYLLLIIIKKIIGR